MERPSLSKMLASSRERLGGGGRSRVLRDGDVFEQGGGTSHVEGKEMPASATAHRPELAGAV